MCGTVHASPIKQYPNHGTQLSRRLIGIQLNTVPQAYGATNESDYNWSRYALSYRETTRTADQSIVGSTGLLLAQGLKQVLLVLFAGYRTTSDTCYRVASNAKSSKERTPVLTKLARENGA